VLAVLQSDGQRRVDGGGKFGVGAVDGHGAMMPPP
jgi:hypothetical protein